MQIYTCIYYHCLSYFLGKNYDLGLKVWHPNDVTHVQVTPSGVQVKHQLDQFLWEAVQIKTSKSCKFDLHSDSKYVDPCRVWVLRARGSS